MKQKGEDFFCLLAVITCVFASALLLRTVFDSSLGMYGNAAHTDAKTEHLRPPRQDAGENAQSSKIEYGESTGYGGFPDYPEASGLPIDSPMQNDMYLAGYHASQHADDEVLNLCYERYGERPLSVTKAYMESPYTNMGYAWIGVVQMEEQVPVIFHYDGPQDTWIQKNDDAPVYSFFDEPSVENRMALQDLVLNNIQIWFEEGFMDWEDRG